ncbi:MAG: YlbF family regulator [Clostridium sp.]|jgi:cell fate (sporulation/competence/biofilm development) regulator YlbF (YheA/YmcA/DUF963 family)|nr:YlbF family regulator [Clostridium sp.]
MIKVHEKAQELADAMKDNETVVAYREAVKKLEQDEQKKQMVKDFRDLQFAAYNDKMTKGDVSDETRKQMEDLVSVIALNTEVSAYLETEQNFTILFNDIMKVINEAIGVDIIG